MEIPSGVFIIAGLSGESAEKIWEGLEGDVNTDEKVEAFNLAIEETVEQLRDTGKTGQEIAVIAMGNAGDAISGFHPIAEFIKSAPALFKR